MIADLKPYADYKESGQAWLGKVPEHWAVRRMKYVVHEVDSRSMSGTEQLLRVSQYTGVTQRSRPDGIDEPDTRADSLVGYKSVRVNDLVVNIMLAWNGSMGVSRYEGIASPAYCVYRFAPEQHPWYFHNLLRSPAYKAKIKASSTGVVESRLRLYSDELGRIVATIPPPNEQAAIVKFLDWANGRLERTIRAKRKAITLLNEQKQAIIHRAVTRGLDPTVALKPSGIPWIGDIPEHWEARKLRQLLSRVTERNRPDLALLSVVREKGVIERDTEDRDGNHNFIPEDLSNYKVVRTGQFAMNKMKAWQGSYGVSQLDGIVSPAYFVFNLRGAGGAFFHTAIRSKAYVPFFTQASDGVRVGQWDLAEPRMKEITFFFPSEAEQVAIVDFVTRETTGISVAISQLEREIELLREYRTRLVADMVTGKFDVREAAARLPDDVPLGTVEDDADLDEDLDIAEEEATA